jgi:hypothetical protein
MTMQGEAFGWSCCTKSKLSVCNNKQPPYYYYDVSHTTTTTITNETTRSKKTSNITQATKLQQKVCTRDTKRINENWKTLNLLQTVMFS